MVILSVIFPIELYKISPITPILSHFEKLDRKFATGPELLVEP